MLSLAESIANAGTGRAPSPLRATAGHRDPRRVHRHRECGPGRPRGLRPDDAVRGTASVRAILVERTDRLYRNIKDWVQLDELGADIHFVKENVVVGPQSRSADKFLHGIKVLMAKNYVDNLGEEVRKGMLEKARQGHWPSVAPIGYVNSPVTRRIEPDPERDHHEALRVVRHRRLFAESPHREGRGSGVDQSHVRHTARAREDPSAPGRIRSTAGLSRGSVARMYHIPLETRFSFGLTPVVWFGENDEPEIVRERETPGQWWSLCLPSRKTASAVSR